MFSRINVLSRLSNGELDYKKNEVKGCAVDSGINEVSIPIKFDSSLCRVFVVSPSSQKNNFDHPGYDSFLVIEDDGFSNHNSANKFVKELKDYVTKYNDDNHLVRIGLSLADNRSFILCVKSYDIDTVDKTVVLNGWQQKLIIIGPFYSNYSLDVKESN